MKKLCCDLELPGLDAILRKEGRRVVVEPLAGHGRALAKFENWLA